MRQESAGGTRIARVPGDPTRPGPMSLLGGRPPRDTGSVFARYFVELPMQPERVEEALLRDPHAWLPGLASEANHQGDALLAEVGFGDDVRVARKVAIEFGSPVRMPTQDRHAPAMDRGGRERPVPLARRRSRDRPAWHRTARNSR